MERAYGMQMTKTDLRHKTHPLIRQTFFEKERHQENTHRDAAITKVESIPLANKNE